MKLYRTELESGFKNKQIILSSNSLKLEEVNEKIHCELSCDKSSSGYRVFGAIISKINLLCDRCLVNYDNDLSAKLDVILTNNEEIINEMSSDVIRFMGSDDFVDITKILRDIILLEEPIKKVCSQNCKGLCSSCGLNLNNDQCKCKKIESNQNLKELEKLIN